MQQFDPCTSLGRRAFLKGGSLVLAAATLDKMAPLDVFADGESPGRAIRIGLVTDLHYADKPPVGSRHYRETPAKLAEAAGRFSRDRPDFLVHLGDLIDSADSVAAELAHLRRINEVLSGISQRRHYVLGNHCVSTLTKEEFLGEVGQERSHYSFDAGGHHFVVLDSCFRSDGQPYGRKNFEWTDANVPGDELEWLGADLAGTPHKTLVFAHQRLDVGRPHGVRNAPAVRKVLEGSGKVRAVFQGHSHRNDYRDISGIHYATLVAMVEGSGAENNGYATVDLDRSGSIRVHGFRQQKDYRWPA
jgi:predicted phosphodiesterase